MRAATTTRHSCANYSRCPGALGARRAAAPRLRMLGRRAGPRSHPGPRTPLRSLQQTSQLQAQPRRVWPLRGRRWPPGPPRCPLRVPAARTCSSADPSLHQLVRHRSLVHASLGRVRARSGSRNPLRRWRRRPRPDGGSPASPPRRSACWWSSMASWLLRRGAARVRVAIGRAESARERGACVTRLGILACETSETSHLRILACSGLRACNGAEVCS